jgi:hypothetical protein
MIGGHTIWEIVAFRALILKVKGFSAWAQILGGASRGQAG